jgi:hypothetical protein
LAFDALSNREISIEKIPAVLMGIRGERKGEPGDA